LFDLPDDAPDRLTRARLALERAEAALADAEAGRVAWYLQRDAVADARYELKLAETERLRR
jgi:hypothetical protein